MRTARTLGWTAVLGAALLAGGLPAAATSPEVEVPAVPGGADPGTTLFIGPAGDGRSGLFGRDLDAAGEPGPWRLLATDADAPYEFGVSLSTAADGAMATAGGSGPMADDGPVYRTTCGGKRTWETNEDTQVQSVEFRNVNQPFEHTSMEFRYQFHEEFCEQGTTGSLQGWFKNEKSSQQVFIRAHILNQDKNADSAMIFDEGVGGPRRREGIPFGWEKGDDWGLPYWFKVFFKALWQEGEPSHTAVDNTSWPSGNEMFPIGYHCPEYGPWPVHQCHKG